MNIFKLISLPVRTRINARASTSHSFLNSKNVELTQRFSTVEFYAPVRSHKLTVFSVSSSQRFSILILRLHQVLSHFFVIDHLFFHLLYHLLYHLFHHPLRHSLLHHHFQSPFINDEFFIIAIKRTVYISAIRLQPIRLLFGAIC